MIPLGRMWQSCNMRTFVNWFLLLLLGRGLIRKKLVDMRTDSGSLDRILEVYPRRGDLMILRLVVLTGHLNKSKTDQIFLQPALQVIAKARLAFLLVLSVERIIMVLAGELLVHVLIVGDLIIK